MWMLNKSIINFKLIKLYTSAEGAERESAVGNSLPLLASRNINELQLSSTTSIYGICT
jgi:hypothetical protein